MAVIRINAVGDRPVLHGSPAALEGALQRAGAEGGPVIVMAHGYKYRPGAGASCPHRHLLSLDPDHLPWRAPSWPRQLGYGLGHTHEGLAIPFGWNAGGTLRQAQASAFAAGRALAQVCALLHAQAPNRPLHVIGHSLGIELALEALHHLPAGSISRIVSLYGASFQSRAHAALATPAGQAAEFINVTSRENDPFDFLFERLTRLQTRGDKGIGQGLDASNAVTLQLDCAATLSHLQDMGYTIAQPQRRICHWSSYMRPGALRFYRHLLRYPERTPLSQLRIGLPNRSTPRRSRLFALRMPPAPLPGWQQV